MKANEAVRPQLNLIIRPKGMKEKFLRDKEREGFAAYKISRNQFLAAEEHSDDYLQQAEKQLPAVGGSEDLAELWETVEADSREEARQTSLQAQLVLSSEEYQAIFGKEEDVSEGQGLLVYSHAKYHSPIKIHPQGYEPQGEEPQGGVDLGELWDCLDEDSSPRLCQYPGQAEVYREAKSEAEPHLKYPSEAAYEETHRNWQIDKHFCIYDPAQYCLAGYPPYCFTDLNFKQVSNSQVSAQVRYVLFDAGTGYSLLFAEFQPQQPMRSIGDMIEYDGNTSLVFTVVRTGEKIAVASHRKTKNGIMYSLKRHNFYDSSKSSNVLAYFEISEAFLSNNCYCSTSVYLPAVEAMGSDMPVYAYSRRLEMSIELDRGRLVTNMKRPGIMSTSYNCRLEDREKKYLLLIGMLRREGYFLVRVGTGVSPLIAFAVAVGRKSYIDSFAEK